MLEDIKEFLQPDSLKWFFMLNFELIFVGMIGFAALLSVLFSIWG